MLGGTLEQPYIFLAAVYCGMICGAAYCLLRPFRRGKASTIASDMIFGVFSMAAMALTLALTTYFEIRPYFFAGVFAGLSIFLFGFSPLFAFARSILSKKCKFSHESVDIMRK